ncbi:MAG TPA: hypothetical protein VFF78_03865 [Anaerolineaceae bacterium]|nr:hypothetical protein [Anaerolineaceae bacterium]
MNYATLTQVKAYLGQAPAASADNLLLDFIDQASRYIEQCKGRRFDVRQETRLFDIPGLATRTPLGYFPGIRQGNYAQSVLKLDDDLLALTTLTNGDGTVIASTDYFLEPGNLYPKRTVRLSDSVWAVPSSGDPHQAISVDGLWGFHNHYPEAWVDSMDSVQDVGGINASVNTFKVLDSDGIAGDLRGPRFQSGQMISIGTEFMLVISANNQSNDLVIRRGYNGTTAAVHAQGAAISIFRPMGIVEIACIRLVAWRYKQKDVDNFDKTYIMGGGVVNVPTSIPSDVVRFLGAHKAEL